MTSKPKPAAKTLAAQKTSAAEKHPRMTAGLDNACTAHTLIAGVPIECELAINHAGHHSGNGRSWRPTRP